MGAITTTLHIKTDGAQRSLDALLKKINKLNGLSTAIEKSVTAENKLANAVRKTSTAQDNLNKKASQLSKHFKNANSQASNLSTTIKRLAATYLGVMGGKVAVNSADVLTQANNRFKTMGVDSAETMNKIYASSLATYSGYADNLQAVAKLMTNSGDAFQGNIDAAIRFNEIMQKSYVIGGASAAEQASSMYQMVQALGSGILQGDELRSVREGAPQAYKAIEEFAQGVYGAEKSLKDLASQGLITSDMVVAAMLSAGDSIDKAFEGMDMTFAQLWTNFKNQALRAFTPVLEKLREFMNSDTFKTFVNNVVNVMAVVAQVITWVFEGFVNAFNWVAENWNWISKILLVVVYIMAVILAYQVAMSIAFAVMQLIMMASVCLPLLIVLAIIIAIAMAFLIWPEITAGVAAFIAAVLVDAILLVWMAIVYVVAAALAVIIYAITIIMEIVIAVIAIIVLAVLALYNLILMVIGGIVGGLMSLGAGALAVAQNIGIAFVNAFNWAKEQGLNFAASVLNAIVKVAKMINSILGVFGIEISTGALESTIQGLRDKADAAGSNKVEYKDVGDAMKSSFDKGYNTVTSISADLGGVESGFVELGDGLWGAAGSLTGDVFKIADGVTPDLVNPMDWYDAGYEWGGKYDWRNMFDTFGIGGDKTGNYMLDTFGGDGSSVAGLNLDDLGLGGNIPDIADNAGKAAKGSKKTADNTDKIADSMDLMSDELEYLRDIAEQEVINRFTGVTFNVGGITTNYDGDTSLDGIVTVISKQLREALVTSAEGVHA